MYPMKEYRLVSLPDLGSSFDKIAFRRILSDLSHRHLSFSELVRSSGLRRQEVRRLLDALDALALLESRECETDFSAPASLWDSLLETPERLRRALNSSA